MVSISDVLLIAAAFANLAIGIIVLRYKSIQKTNLFFFLFVMMTVVWSFSNFLIDASRAWPEVSLLWVRVSAVSMACAPWLFILFAHRFPVRVSHIAPWVFKVGHFLIFIWCVISFTPYLIEGVDTGKYPVEVIKGPLYDIFIIYIALFLVIALITLVYNFFHVKGRDKNQLMYLFVGSFLMIMLGMTTNILLPHFLDIKDYVRLGPTTPLIFVAFTAYAIVRYRLMDIKLVVLRAFLFTLLMATFFGVYGIIFYIVITRLQQLGLSEEHYTTVGTVGTMLAVAGFYYYRIVLQKITDKFLFHDRPNYRRSLVASSQNLAATIKIDEVTDIVLKTMQTVIRSSKTIILLQDTNTGNFEKRASQGINDSQKMLPSSNVLIRYLQQYHEPIVKDELTSLKEGTISRKKYVELNKIQNTIDWLDVSAVIPLYVNKELAGIILLGDKLSGEAYLKDDIEFLAAFAPQAAVALDNANLYAESLEFGEKLKDEVQKATQELETANIQLRDLDKAKSEFLSIASHQLYTPLTALRGYISMLMEGDFGKLNDQQKPILDILEKSSNRLIELIKNLLDISRIESGRLELNLESVDLAELAKELVQDLLPNSINKGLKMKFHDPEKEIPHAVVDEQRLRQVMLNFVDNAIKYTAQGTIDVYMDREGDELVFSVVDTGKGITHDEIAKLFNKFSRVGGSARFHTEGTGLGLYVAKQIVKEHRGDLYVESPGLNQGSTFIMRLPIEGSAKSLNIGEKSFVVIKAAEAIGEPTQS